MTLKDAQVGSTVKVVKIHGEGAYKQPHHGYGHHEGKRDFYSKSSSAGRSGRGYDSWI